jgi:putative polyhydroxyalkanoate system protein
MSDIHLKRAHGTTLTKAKKAAQNIADQMEASLELEMEWEGNTLWFERKGVNGMIEVSKTEIHIEVKLGIMLKPFKVKIQEAIERNMDQLFQKG